MATVSPQLDRIMSQPTASQQASRSSFERLGGFWCQRSRFVVGAPGWLELFRQPYQMLWRKKKDIPEDAWEDMQSVAASPPDAALELFVEMRSLDYFLHKTRTSDSETVLAKRLNKAMDRDRFTAAQLQELEEFRGRAVHPVVRARSAQLLEGVEPPPDPMEIFADVAQSRLGQGLLSLQAAGVPGRCCEA